MSHSYVHEIANKIPEGLERSQLTKGGKKVLGELEKLDGDKQTQNEKTQFMFFFLTLAKKGGFTREEMQLCQPMIVEAFYKEADIFANEEIDRLLLSMMIKLGREVIVEEKK